MGPDLLLNSETRAVPLVIQVTPTPGHQTTFSAPNSVVPTTSSTVPVTSGFIHPGAGFQEGLDPSQSQLPSPATLKVGKLLLSNNFLFPLNQVTEEDMASLGFDDLNEFCIRITLAAVLLTSSEN
jgi:hypothetical protein